MKYFTLLAVLSVFFFKIDAFEYLPEINDIKCTCCCRLIRGTIDIKDVEVFEENVSGTIEFKMPRTIYGSLIPSPRIYDMILVFIESSGGKANKNIGCHNLGFFKITPWGRKFLDIKTEHPTFKIPKYVFEKADRVAVIFKKRIPGL